MMRRVGALVLSALLLSAVPRVGPDGRWSFNMEDPSGTGPAGAPQHGLALAIVPPSSIMRLGSPMWIVLEIRNVSGRWIALNGLWPGSYGLQIVDRATGATLTNPELANPKDPAAVATEMRASAGPFGARSMLPKRSAFGAIRLDTLYQLKQGSYLIRLVVGSIPVWFSEANSPPATVTLQSNTIAIEVLPARASSPWPGDTRGISEGAVGDSPAGAVSHGFALSLKTEPLGLVAELRNVSGRAKDVRFAGMAYVVTVKNLRTGRIVVVGSQLRSWHAEKRLGEPLFPDTSLYAQFDPAETYALEGDRYLVTVTGYPTLDGARVTLVSNAIVLTVPRKNPTVPFAPGIKILKTGLASSRPVYLQGETVLLRIALTNKIARDIIMWAGPIFSISRSVGNDARPTTSCQFSSIGMALRSRPESTLIRANATVVAQEFRRWNEWTGDFARAGCRFDEPGLYMLTASVKGGGIVEGAGVNYSFADINIKPSEPMQIRVVTRQEARAIPPALLDDAAESAAIRQLVPVYATLRASMLDVIDHVARGETQTQVTADSGEHWGDDYDAFRSAVGALSGLGDPSSRYVDVTANLDEVSYHLREASQDAHDYCDPVAARRDIDVADYFIAAVREEIARGSASVLDASYPAPSLQPRGGLCRWQ